jgi:hypothetical protein
MRDSNLAWPLFLPLSWNADLLSVAEASVIVGSWGSILEERYPKRKE